MTDEHELVYWNDLLMVEPKKLYKQSSFGAPLPIANHQFFVWAKSIACEDVPPESNLKYLNPESFRGIIDSMKSDGWTNGSVISVAIDEWGKVLVTDGMHRATAALALGIKKIPATVVFRSGRWLKLKCSLYHLNDAPTLYHKINHPDLDKWKVIRDDSVDRANVILGVAGEGCSKALDYGCNTGAVSAALSSPSLKVHGYDINPDCIKIARLLKSMNLLSNKGDAIFIENPSAKDEYDFSIILSVLHHYVDADPKKATEILRYLSSVSPTIFFDCAKSGDVVGGTSEYTDPYKMARFVKDSIDAKGRTDIVRKDGRRPLISWKKTDLTAVGIVGAAFTGSTTLCMVMDSIPGVFGTGEDIAVKRDGSKCKICADKCHIWTEEYRTRLKKEDFGWWDKISEMSGSNVIVSSNKGPHNYNRLGHPDKVMLLWKDPRAWVMSWVRRHLLKAAYTPIGNIIINDENIGAAMDAFMRHYSLDIEWITRYKLDCVSFSIEQLALLQAGLLRPLCDWIGIDVAEKDLLNALSYRNFKHHQINGNDMASCGKKTKDYKATFGDGLAIDDRWKSVLTEKQEKIITGNADINKMLERIKKWQILQQ